MYYYESWRVLEGPGESWKVLEGPGEWWCWCQTEGSSDVGLIFGSLLFGCSFICFVSLCLLADQQCRSLLCFLSSLWFLHHSSLVETGYFLLLLLFHTFQQINNTWNEYCLVWDQYKLLLSVIHLFRLLLNTPIDVLVNSVELQSSTNVALLSFEC